MSILVTGGAGYIGSHTCIDLLAEGYDIVVADNLVNSKTEAVERVKKIAKKDFPFYEVDIRDKDALKKIFAENDIDCVIHFAGLKAVGESVSIPIKYYQNNVDSTLVLCDVMKEAGVKRIIFSSSATVYSAENKMPLTEDSLLGCSNPYGWTKYMCEQILSDIAHAEKDWSVVLLRYFNPVGAHESGLIGEDPSGIPNNLVPYITQTAVGKLKELSVYGNDYNTKDGTGVRDFIHVLDLAKGHVAAVKFCESNKGTEVFNLGTGNGTSVLELVDAFEKANNVKVPHKIVDRRPGDIGVCYADPAKASSGLQWKAEKSISDMCVDSWRWQSMNPSGYANN